MISVKFDWHEKRLLEQKYFTGSMTLVTVNHSFMTGGGPRLSPQPALLQSHKYLLKGVLKDEMEFFEVFCFLASGATVSLLPW